MKRSKEFSVLLIFALMVLGASIASCDNEEEEALLEYSKTETIVPISTMESLDMSQGTVPDTSTAVGIVVPTDPIVPTDPTVFIPVTREDSLLMGYVVSPDTTASVVPTDPTDPTVFIPVTKEDSILVFGLR